MLILELISEYGAEAGTAQLFSRRSYISTGEFIMESVKGSTGKNKQRRHMLQEGCIIMQDYRLPNIDKK